MTHTAAELCAAVASAAEATPYRVEPTPEGFDLRIDVAETRWHGLLGTVGRRRVVQSHVRLDPEKRTLQITDDVFRVTWAVGLTGRTPRLVAAAEAKRLWGRTWSASREWTWRPGERPREKQVVERRLGTAEAHRLIRHAAAELGWTERMGFAERVGLVGACLGGAALLAVALLLLLGGRT